MKVLVLMIFLIVSCSAPKSGQDIIKAMHDKYDGKWYKTLTFKQETTWYKPDGEVAKNQLWYEALSMPNQLVIKFDSLNSGTGILFKNDKMSQFNNGSLVGSMDRKHDLLILGFDVYFDSPESTISKLEEMNYNLNLVYEDNIAGQDVYIIGQDKNVDSVMNHFVIDKENLLFQYMKKTNPRTKAISKTLFADYEKLDGGWVGKRVDFLVNNKLFLKEIYKDVKVNVELDPEIFNPDKFSEARW